MEDVYNEIDTVLTRQRVGMYKIKPCRRKYAFEKTDIPKEAEYMKLLYPYDSEATRSRYELDLIDSQNLLFLQIFTAKHFRMYLAQILLSSSNSSCGRILWALVG